MLAGVDPAHARRASGSRSASRRRRRRAPRRPSAGLAVAAPRRRARRRASSPATTTARSSSGAASSRAPARSSTSGHPARLARRPLALHARASAAGSGSPPAGRCTRFATDAATNTVVVGPREALARTSLRAAGRLYVPVDRAEVKVRYRSPAVAATVEPTARGFRLELDEPAYGVAPGQTAVLYEDDVVVGAGTARLRPKIAAMLASVDWSDVAYAALAVFLVLAGLALAYGAFRLGGTLGRASSLIEGTETELLPVISKLGGTLDRVNTQLDKVDVMTDSAVDAVTTVDTAVRTVTSVVTCPCRRSRGSSPVRGTRRRRFAPARAGRRRSRRARGSGPAGAGSRRRARPERDEAPPIGSPATAARQATRRAVPSLLPTAIVLSA